MRYYDHLTLFVLPLIYSCLDFTFDITKSYSISTFGSPYASQSPFMNMKSVLFHDVHYCIIYFLNLISMNSSEI